MSADRCTGRCCRRFVLPYAPEELSAKAGKILDGAFIADMVQYVGLIDGEHRYDCRHLLDSGDCAVYVHRPVMCLDYPYQRPCSHGTECAFESAREGRALRKRHLPIVGVGGNVLPPPTPGACRVHPVPESLDLVEIAQVLDEAGSTAVVGETTTPS